MSAVLDTHAAIWYFHRSKELSSAALQSIRRAVEGGRPVYVSAISLVETIYLVERGRLPLEALQRLEAGLKGAASGLLVQPVDEDVAQAVHRVPRDVVPDMPEASSLPQRCTSAYPSSRATSESNPPGSRQSGRVDLRK